MNPTIEALKTRVSLRRYADRPITDETLSLILDMALRAPTAGNMTLYSIVAIRDEKTKLRLSETCDHQPFIAKAPVVLIFLADFERYRQYLKHSRVADFAAASNMPIRRIPYSTLYLGLSDATIAAQNAAIAAESMGIGSCYIGDIVENYEAHKELLGLEDQAVPVAMLTLGYYPEGLERKITPRPPHSVMVHYEKYSKMDQETLNTLDDFYRERMPASNPFGAENFGQLIFARKLGDPFMQEMERSIKVMVEKWASREIE